MIRRLVLALLLLTPLHGSLARNAPAPAPWPREVQAIFDGYQRQCIKAGGKFVPDRPRFATSTELTGDGKPDWVIEDSAFDCKVPQSVLDNGGDYPETGSGFCGTAGCNVTILGSGPKGLSTIFGGNLRDWKAVDLGAGRRGMETSVHGSACGGAGADVCIETLAWNGRKWALVKRYRWTAADHAADQRRMAAMPDQSSPRHVARWQSAGSAGNALAAVTGHPEIAAFALRCQPGGGIYVTAVPKPGGGLVLPPEGRPLLLSFEGPDSNVTADLALTREPGKPDYSGALTAPLEALLTGKDDGLALLASADGGQEWQHLTYFSLAGSTAAVRALKAQCPGGQAQARATPLARIPLAVGYYTYVEGRSFTCATASNPIYFDGTRFWEVTDFTDPKHEISSQDLTWEMVSADRFQITSRDRGEDGRWNSFRTVRVYVITGPQSYRFIGTVGTQLGFNENYQLCTPAQLPAKARWFKGAK